MVFFEHCYVRRLNMNETDLKVTKTDDFATEAEIRSHIKIQAESPSPRVFAAAAAILNKHPGLKIHTTEYDLIGSAYSSILGERNWNKSKVDFFGLVFGAMRSIASDATRKATHTRAKLTYGHEEFDEVNSVSSTELEEDKSPEDILIGLEDSIDQDNRIAKLRESLANDLEALTILNLLLEHGLTKSEIRSKLGMADKQFWAADRRLERAVRKLGDK